MDETPIPAPNEGRANERANLAELLDELDALHGRVPETEIARALAMWPDTCSAPDCAKAPGHMGAHQ